MSHLATTTPWGTPTWPPTPPDARTGPGRAVARLGIDSRCLISPPPRRGGPRHGPPPPPTLGRAPAEPWRASGLIQDVSSRHHHAVGDPDMAPHTPRRSDAPRQSRGAPRD